MSYLPGLTPDALKGEQLEAYNKVNDLANRSFGATGEVFEWKDSSGALIGPFGFALTEPGPGLAYMDVISALSKLPFAPNARETAILTTGAHFNAGYEIYAHVKVAESKKVLSEAQVNGILSGQKPSDLDDACSAAYDVAYRLAAVAGPLPKTLWDASVKHLGIQGTMALVHYCGYYAYTCMILNAINAQYPLE